MEPSKKRDRTAIFLICQEANCFVTSFEEVACLHIHNISTETTVIISLHHLPVEPTVCIVSILY